MRKKVAKLTNWIGIRIMCNNGKTEEEFICNICKADPTDPCRMVSFLGDKPTKCKEESNLHISLAKEETTLIT